MTGLLLLRPLPNDVCEFSPHPCVGRLRVKTLGLEHRVHEYLGICRWIILEADLRVGRDAVPVDDAELTQRLAGPAGRSALQLLDEPPRALASRARGQPGLELRKLLDAVIVEAAKDLLALEDRERDDGPVPRAFGIPPRLYEHQFDSKAAAANRGVPAH